MSRWVSLLFLLAGLLTAATCRAADTTDWFSDATQTERYDCTLALTTAKTLAAATPLSLLLEAAEDGGHTRVTVTRRGVKIDTVAGGRAATRGVAPLNITPGAPCALTVMRRGDWLGILHGETFIFRGAVPRAAGARAGVQAGKGWTVADARVQPLEPVVFADNFMRTADENGGWTVLRGSWQLQSAWDSDPKGGSLKFATAAFATNPFAWVGRAGAEGALCVTGNPFWEDYTFSMAVCPPADGAAGIALNLGDPQRYLLARWTPVSDRGPQGNQLILYRVEAGKRTELARSAGGYLPGQWYRLSAVSGPEGVRVLVDGRERLAVANVMPWRGAVGLYAEGAPGHATATQFDDVTVYGRSVKTALIEEHRQAQISERFAADTKGMGEWALNGHDWEPMPGMGSFRRHRWDFFGDHWLTVPFTAGSRGGTLTLILNGDGENAMAGCRALLEQSADGNTLTCTLYRGMEKLAVKAGTPLNPGEEYAIRFARAGARLRVEVDGEPLLEAEDAAMPAGLRPAYEATGCFAQVGEVLALGARLLDYAFTDAPTDWLTEGTWMPTTRWACSNQWSFLGGWSRGDAVLWHKARFAGDQTFQVFMAPKMEYPREHETYWTRFRDLAVTICGDGSDSRSGYTLIHGAPDDYGNANRRTVLLRNGVVVQSTPYPVSGALGGTGHTNWFDLTLSKRGAVVEALVEGKRLFTFTDPRPLEGGVPAVWTTDNGIAVARARIACASVPAPRDDPQVFLDDPWYPAWANVGRPLTLDFARACATSGTPVTLQVTPKAQPPEAGAETAVAGTRVTLTPRASGEHWYHVQATDGATRSGAFHITLPVYDPAKGRDDSRAVVLYRFDEADGRVIKDQSAVQPAADLIIPEGAPVERLPGQGITIHGPGRIMTRGGVPKLMALAKQRAATIELWINVDTVHPPTYWLAGLLAWEQPNEVRNFAVSQMWWDLAVAPRGRTFHPWRNVGAVCRRVLRTGLQHVAVTWDGTATRCYVNGHYAGMWRSLAWREAEWDPNAPLILGSLAPGQPNNHDDIANAYGIGQHIMPNRPEMEHCFLGSIYLAAVHDRCFTQDEVKRHYQAGPSAR